MSWTTGTNAVNIQMHIHGFVATCISSKNTCRSGALLQQAGGRTHVLNVDPSNAVHKSNGEPVAGNGSHAGSDGVSSCGFPHFVIDLLCALPGALEVGAEGRDLHMQAAPKLQEGASATKIRPYGFAGSCSTCTIFSCITECYNVALGNLLNFLHLSSPTFVAFLPPDVAKTLVIS